MTIDYRYLLFFKAQSCSSFTTRAPGAGRQKKTIVFLFLLATNSKGTNVFFPSCRLSAALAY